MKQLVSRARCLETVHPSKVHLVHFLSHSSLFQPFAYSALRLLFLCSDTGDTGILASCCESSRLDSPNCCCETSHCRPSAAAVLQSVQLVEIRVRVNHCGAGNVQVNATTHTSQSGSLILTTLSTILPLVGLVFRLVGSVYHLLRLCLPCRPAPVPQIRRPARSGKPPEASSTDHTQQLQLTLLLRTRNLPGRLGRRF